MVNFVDLKIKAESSLSVCMATFNGSAYLKEQIDSILSQLGPNDELLVADDGSQDGTVDILKSYGPSLTVISASRIGGVVENFSRVISAADGDYIALADQDDVWLPGRVALIKKTLENTDLIQMNAQVVDGDLHSLNVTVFASSNVRPGFLSNLIKNSFVGCCMAFRREIIDMVRPFPSNIPWHDWYIGLIAELFFKVERVDAVTISYRRHENNFSATGGKSKYSLYKKIVMRLQIIRAVVRVVGKYGLFKALAQRRRKIGKHR